MNKRIQKKVYKRAEAKLMAARKPGEARGSPVYPATSQRGRNSDPLGIQGISEMAELVSPAVRKSQG